MKPVDQGAWCTRLEEAVLDGRFLEDPAFWRPHVEACSTCREMVEGVFLLRDSIGRARLDDDLSEPPVDADAVITGAITRHRARGRRQIVFWSLGAALVLALGGWVVSRGVDSDCRVAPASPLARSPEAADAYGDELYRRIFPLEGPVRDRLLVEDEALRAEYVRALDHPNSYVRRVAVDALSYSRVSLPIAGFARALSVSEENLRGPLVVASADAGQGRIVEALNQRRSDTLFSVLSAIEVQAEGGGERVPPDLVRPYLLHAQPRVRQAALQALEADDRYAPGPEVDRLLTSDEDAQVRSRAATVLLRRRGARGAEQVVAAFRAKPDVAVEQGLVGALGEFPAGISLARERVDDAATPLTLALLHARVLARKGDRAAALRWIPKAVADGDADAVYWSADVAREFGMTEFRLPLQERWRAVNETWRLARERSRTDVAVVLVRWDESVGDEGRILLAQEVMDGLARDRGDPARSALRRMTKSERQGIRIRAQDLLSEASPH